MEFVKTLPALLRRLMTVSGVSGREQKIREAIIEEVKPYADEITVDPMGNLIVRKKGNGKKIMFCAHMDEIGFFVTYITSDGFIKVSSVGGIDTLAASFTEVVSERGVAGIIVPESSKEKPEMDGLYIDIGAKSKKEAERRVRVGEYFVCRPVMRKLMGQRYVGRPFDDRIGCAILVEALKNIKENESDLYFVFSVQEEVGGKGSRPAAYTIAPDYGICLDVTCLGDKPGSPTMAVSMGKGCTIKLKDSGVLCSPELIKSIKGLIKENGDVKYQDEVLIQGGTDASGMQVAGRGAQVTGISIPTANIHSGVEMVDMNDASEAVKLVILISEKLK